MKTTRDEVYKAIDSERIYQDSLGPDRRERTDDPVEHVVGSYITMLQCYQNKLVEAWVNNPGDKAALDVMRKVAGIAVHCMEEHGAPHRK